MTLPWGSSLILENSNLNWNLARKALVTTSTVFQTQNGTEYFQPIPRQTGIIFSPILLIGTSCSHKTDNWTWGGTLYIYSSFFPDSQSEFVATGLIFKQSLKLGNLNLVVAPRIKDVTQYVWELEIPKYFKDVFFEIYWHDGPFTNSLEIKE